MREIRLRHVRVYDFVLGILLSGSSAKLVHVQMSVWESSCAGF